MNEHDEDDEKLSDDPEEQLRLENELLKLKLNAELGGTFEALTDIPPEIEHQFLQNVIAFEKNHANAVQQTVYEVLGNPGYINADELLDEDVLTELERLEKLLEEKAIMVDYSVEYPARLKYTFLTEELFKHESSMFSMPGMTTHYIYEEFHPNHEYEIRSKTEAFILAWIDMDMTANNRLLADVFREKNELTADQKALLQKVQWFFESFIELSEPVYTIDTIAFEVDSEGMGSGFSQGSFRYDADTEDENTTIVFNGPFTINFTCEYNYWKVNNFQLPGLHT